MKRHLIRSVVIFGVMCFACLALPERHPTLTGAIKTSAGQVPISPQDLSEPEQMFSTFFTEGDSLSYNAYQVVKLEKSVDDEYTKDIRVSYALLKRNATVTATFDGVYFGLGNATDFGLAPLLGPESKLLIVSQTIPRGGRHWVADISSDGSILFDSFDYDLGREEVWILDIDDDGVSELGLLLTAFWGFETLAMCQHEALPMIVFKYDASHRKYIPANPIFGYGLEGIEEDVQRIDPGETLGSTSYAGDYLAKRLGIFLRYVYSGRRQQAWAFFERTYQLPDAAKVKAKIRAKLRKEPVYRFIYGRHPNTPTQP